MELQTVVLFLGISFAVAEYNPGDRAPPFTLPTLSGPLVYKALNNTNIQPPIIFHEYSSHSAFLDALWHDDSSVAELLHHSPDNTQYVFFSSTTDAQKVAEWMKKRFKEVLEKYYTYIKHDRGRYDKKQSRTILLFIFIKAVGRNLRWGGGGWATEK